MKVLQQVTPESARWRYLSVDVLGLSQGETMTIRHEDEEALVVLVAGDVHLRTGDVDARLQRASPFAEVSTVAYVPPRCTAYVDARRDSQVSIARAPAQGLYQAHVVRPAQMAGEVRGGDKAIRQVITTFSPQVPAERLIAYEAWVPRGGWTGWPPHRHDGLDGSPYLEETYFYRFDNEAGFGVHRNFDLQRDFEELVGLRDGSLVTVPRGYHLCACGPSGNAWILNFLAGAPEDRPRLPVFDPSETWIANDWQNGAWSLPVVELPMHDGSPQIRVGLDTEDEADGE